MELKEGKQERKNNGIEKKYVVKLKKGQEDETEDTDKWESSNRDGKER